MTWSDEDDFVVEMQICSQERQWLESVFAEWKATLPPPPIGVGFGLGAFNDALAEAKQLSNEALADYIWEQASEQHQVTEDGDSAFCCPYRCHFLPIRHTA